MELYEKFKNLLVMTMVTLLMVGLAEILLRTLAPIYVVGSTSWYQYDDELGVLVRPSMHSFRLTDSLNEMRTNSRPIARAIERPSEVLPTPGGPAKHRIGPRES